MRLIKPLQEFSFSYPAYDQNASLFVAFNIYNVSTGVPVFVSKVIATYTAYGAYLASYVPGSGQTFLIIGVAYTDNTYSTVDTTRAPSCDTWQTTDTVNYFFNFVYGAYDQNTSLYALAKIYQVVADVPTFVGSYAMTHIAFGVYYANFSGTNGITYQAVQMIFLDSGYTTPDPNRSPNVDEYDAFNISTYSLLVSEAALTGQSLEAVLTGQSLTATLTGEN